jgi:hypothetical protein
MKPYLQNNHSRMGGGVAQVEEYLLCKCEYSNPSPTKENAEVSFSFC